MKCVKMANFIISQEFMVLIAVFISYSLCVQFIHKQVRNQVCVHRAGREKVKS